MVQAHQGIRLRGGQQLKYSGIDPLRLDNQDVEQGLQTVKLIITQGLFYSATLG